MCHEVFCGQLFPVTFFTLLSHFLLFFVRIIYSSDEYVTIYVALSPQENFPIFPLENSFTLQLFHSFEQKAQTFSKTENLKQ